MNNLDYTEITKDYSLKSTIDDNKLKEVKRFEDTYPGLKLIKPHYDSEEELKADWYAFSASPFSLKMIANHKSFLLFDKNCETLYKINRHEFLKKDIKDANKYNNEYNPGPYQPKTSEKYRNTLAESCMIDNDVVLIPVGSLDEYQLNESWVKYNNQSYEDRRFSDEKSTEIYGLPVSEVYYQEYGKILQEESDYDDYDNETYETDLVMGSVSEQIMNSNDIVESLVLLDMSQPESIVDQSIYNESEEVVKYKIKLSEDIDYLGKSPYFLPWEIEGILDEEVLKDNILFESYYEKCVGLKPSINFNKEYRRIITNESSTKEELLSVGWNPAFKIDEISDDVNAERSNRVFKENCSFNFIDLTSTPTTIHEDGNELSGVAVVILNELNTDKKESKESRVFVSTNPTKSSNWDELIGGRLASKSDLKDAIDKLDYPAVSVYYSKTSPDTKKKIEMSKYENFNKGNVFQSFKSVSKSTTSKPKIANKKLFTMNLMNGILNDKDDPFAVGNKKGSIGGSIFNLFNDCGTYKDVVDSFTKLEIFDEYQEITGSDKAFDLLNMQPVQEVTTLPVEFDEDGNLFIKRSKTMNFAVEYSKCHKMLLHYHRVKNFEAMKYFIAKLWYMNTLIEERIYSRKKIQDKDKLTYYYKTRAFILNDFNKYMAAILDNDPEFDFVAYYRQTPFDKSVLKISRTMVERMWALFKALLEIIKSRIPM